jgi:hypothetical protein
MDPLRERRVVGLMPRFYLHIHDRIGFASDDEGREQASVEEARDEAVKGARSLLSADVADGRLDLRGRIEVMDGHGQLLDVVPFEEVVEIVTGELPASDPERR